MSHSPASRFLGRLITLGLLIFVASWAWGTDRFYGNLNVPSTNGKFRLVATSPDNAGEWVQPFADQFEYRLIETESGNTVWSRQQRPIEGSPLNAYVHDDGTVAIHTSTDHVMILDSVNGKLICEFDILDQFSRSERRRHVIQSSAGPIWTGHSLWIFFEHEGELHFLLRSGWGSRIITDIAGGAKLDEIPWGLMNASLEAERAFVIRTLKKALEDVEILRDTDNFEERSVVITAIVVAAQNRIMDVVPELRVLEKVEDETCLRVVEFDREVHQDLVKPRGLWWHRVRSASQVALRILGQEPDAHLPATRMQYFEPKDSLFFRDPCDGIRFEFPPFEQPTVEKLNLIQIGDTPADVLHKAGLPHSSGRWFSSVWEYHVMDEIPMTVVVRFGDSNQVVEVEEVTPAIWQDGSEWIDRI